MIFSHTAFFIMKALTQKPAFTIIHCIMLHCLAQELNEVLKSTTPGQLLSDFGQRMYFPKGIIAQSAEAKKLSKTANATIGMTVSNGIPVVLPIIQKQLPDFTPQELVAYAPTEGNLELRNIWKEKILKKNPSLAGKSFSLPVVVPGLTAGISYLCDLFLSEDDTLLTADPSWDNYVLIAESRRKAQLKQFNMFTGTGLDYGFNVAAFRNAVMENISSGKLCILLNFPQNPSGYSPTVSEAKEICSIIKEAAETGCKIMVWCDDAYFGLNYADNINPESLFAFLADIHENVFTAKIDGPTKEDFVWGFRCGFLTFAGKGLTDIHYDALIKKLTGDIRSSVSCCSTPPQSILLHTFKEPEQELEAEKNKFHTLLEHRFLKVRAFLETKRNHPVLQPMPFNSGYFMSLRCNGIDAEQLRVALLQKKGIGTVAIDSKTLRVAFSSIDEELIESVYTAIYDIADELAAT